MIFWKEWRSLRARVSVIAAFFIITVLLLPIHSHYDYTFYEIVNYLISWGAGLLLIPAIMGMDAYVGERDQETEEFLLSKPMSGSKLLAGKIGLRLVLTFLLTGILFALFLLRIGNVTEPLYLSTPPFIIWYLTLTILISQSLVLMVTIAVSVRAPYQSTALIVGGSLGIAVAGLIVSTSTWQLGYLQAPWHTFWILVILFLLTTGLASILLLNRQVGRSVVS